MNLLIRKTKLLYHFTAARFVEDIKREGLTKGALPWHRCRKTGEPLVIRNWKEKDMTARQVEGMRSSERTLETLARKGNPVALKELFRLFPGFQWLTTNPEWGQPFCLLGELPFAKNAHRITLLLPEDRVIAWRTVCERLKPQSAEEFNTPAVDWENWWIHEGPIPPSRFLEVSCNPGETISAGLIGGGG